MERSDTANIAAMNNERGAETREIQVMYMGRNDKEVEDEHRNTGGKFCFFTRGLYRGRGGVRVKGRRPRLMRGRRPRLMIGPYLVGPILL